LYASEDAQGLVTCTGGDCNFCSFVDMTNGLIDWTIIIATVLTVLLLAFAGFRLITSAGDASALEHAKKLLLNSFIGILIMLAGWTIVDTGLKMFAGGDLGVWNAVECGKATPVLPPVVGYGVALKEGQGIIVLKDRTVDSLEGPESIVGQTGDGITPFVPGESGNVTFAFASDLAVAQQGHISATLASLQSCVASKILPGEYTITSVSDNRIANGTYTWDFCAKNGQSRGCAHSKGSCHYGGASCVGQSYAMDLRTSTLNSAQKNRVISAAKECGGWGLNEGNHLHISKGQACGCN